MAHTEVEQRHGVEEEAQLRAREREEHAPHGHPTAKPRPARPVHLDNDRDLSRVGTWALSLGGLGFVCAIVFLMIGGILPGALVIAVSLLCALIGILALSLVAHHQG